MKAVNSTVLRLLLDGGGDAPAGVTVGHSELALADGVAVDADWYFPDGEPTGVIYLQHGFFRSNANVSALAVALTRRTNSIVVAPALSSNFLGNDPYWINGSATQGAVAGLFAGDRAALVASAVAAGYPGELPHEYVLAGHSAGGNLGTAAGGLIGADPNLTGIVLLDAVDRDGDMAEGLRRLDGVPVYQIAAERCVCATRSDLLGGLACGFSQPDNPSAVQTVAAGWIADMFAWTTDGIYPDAGEQVALGRAVVVRLAASPS